MKIIWVCRNIFLLFKNILFVNFLYFLLDELSQYLQYQ